MESPPHTHIHTYTPTPLEVATPLCYGKTGTLCVYGRTGTVLRMYGKTCAALRTCCAFLTVSDTSSTERGRTPWSLRCSWWPWRGCWSF